MADPTTTMAGKLPPLKVVRGRETSGRVTQLSRARLCGQIRARDGQSVFFHRSDLDGIRYADLEVGVSVRFELVDDAISGPRAIRIRPLTPARSRPARKSADPSTP